MNIELKKRMEAEIKERKTSAYNNLVEANITLLDKLKWIKEDIKREIYKLENPSINDVFTKKEIIEDLKNILENNK